MKFRIGQGYDVHQLAENHPFWLGGIQIEHTHGAVGHSDADVLIHAICDALLGALALRDIGYHFSNKDPKYKGIDSKKLLAEVMVKIEEKGYAVGNVDAMICLEAPKINPFIPQMQEILAKIMKVESEDVSIKATTSETLGFVGRREGITATAVALVYKKD
ncbi:MAG: 2-C-methyl-D-erythritol 2,4-cyclodiphosphate synthase [Raineya sp.]|jgi:2-C-methyl-D-erythritol 2,4-cyclodiphosphate synthase|nr:2-C-methyl-D-erythritol 2,4-cyclodiphosphate synthase [Raineya sp.]